MNAGSLAPLAFLASLVIGAGGVALLSLLGRAGVFKRNASARFVVSMAMLVALACSAPAFIAGGTIWLQRVPFVSIDANARPGAPQSRSPVAPVTAAASWVSPASATGAIWMLGFLVALARVCAGVLRLRQIRERGAPIGVRATPRGRVRVLAGEHFDVPVAIGYRRPAILLPRAMLALDRGTEFEHVLLHELEHLRRYDDVSSLVQALCMCALWFNPFAHSISARIGAEREMACDEAVVAHTGKRAAYAATLWKIALRASGSRAPALTSAFNSRSYTGRRLDNLLVTRAGTNASPRFGGTLVAALLSLTFIGTAAVAPATVLAPAPLRAYTLVRLGHGETLVVGGRRSDGAPYSDIQIYDAHGRRTALVPMPLPRWSATAKVRRDGSVLIAGGENASGRLRCAIVYDAARGRFHDLPPSRHVANVTKT